MALYITSLNSGSNGNCYYVGNDKEAILVDAGISCREIEKRMKRLGLSMQLVKAVFVSHEHSDHIKGLPTLAKKYQLPLYITTDTMRYCRVSHHAERIIPFTASEPVRIGDLEITAFRKKHDACDPYSFVVSCNKIKVGVFTDIGSACDNLVKHFSECHAAFLEANYDEVMLREGSYPYHLKRRISGGQGHLSNTQALKLFQSHRPAFMSHLFLSHLSQNNNCPKLVEELFTTHAAGTKIIIASRFQETPVYQIDGSFYHLPILKGKRVRSTVSVSQLQFQFA